MTIFFYRTCLFIFCLCYCTFIYSYHVPGNVQSNDLSNIHEKLDDTFDAYVKGAMQDWSVPGMALGIIKVGQIVVAKYYGFRNINNPALVDENTVFPLASVTKSFTATLLCL